MTRALRSIILLCFFGSIAQITIAQQTYGDGCMTINMNIARSWVEEYEDPFADDESVFHWYGADNGNVDGLGWTYGSCLEQCCFFYIGWWDHSDVTAFSYTYGTVGTTQAATVPQYLQLRGQYMGWDCGSSCGYDGFSSNPFDACFYDPDDYGYDDVLSSTFNYRFAPPYTNSISQLFTTNHGGSDYGAEIVTNWTSPIPVLTSNATIICSGQATSISMNASGAVFGGSYELYQNGTFVTSNTTGVFTASISSATTFRVYTRNNGQNSLCYAEVNVAAINCDFNCVTKSATLPSTYSFDASQGDVEPSDIAYNGSGIPIGSFISDVNVDVYFDKTAGTCAAPTAGASAHNQTFFWLYSNNNGTLQSTSLVNGGFTGGADISPGVTITVDDDASQAVTGTPTNGTAYLPQGGNLNLWQWQVWSVSPAANWYLRAGDNAASNPLCVKGYSVTVCGCKPPISATVNGQSSFTLCTNDPGTVSLAVSGSLTQFDANGYGTDVRWYTGSCGGTFVGSGNPLSVPSPTTTTTYYAQYFVDGQVCGGNPTANCASVTVTVDALPVPGTAEAAGASSDTICATSSAPNISLSGFTGTITHWERSSDGGATWINTGSASNPYSPGLLAAGTYQFRAAVSNGTCPEDYSGIFTLVVNAEPVGGNAILVSASTICSDSVIAFGLVGYTGTIQWQISTSGSGPWTDIVDGIFDFYDTIITNSTTTAATYYFRARLTNEPCTETYSSVINTTVNPYPTLDSVVVQSVLCNGQSNGTITVYATSPSILQYSSNGGTSFQSSQQFTNLAPGNYDVLVKDVVGCATTYANNPVAITEPTVLTMAATPTDVTCFGAADGTITVTATGGTTPYGYSLDNINFQASNVFSGLNGGNYSVVVQDANGCSASTQLQIFEAPQVVVSVVQTAPVLCWGELTASLTASATGGSSGFVFSWSNGVNAATNANIGAGTYTVTATDASNCTGMASYVVTEPTQISTVVGAQGNDCFGDENGFAVADATGGTPPYVYEWSTNPPNFTNLANDLTAGTYYITVSDLNGCEKVDSATVTEPSQMDIILVPDNVLCFGGYDGEILVQASGGAGGYVYGLNGYIQTDSIFLGLPAGSYSISVEDANGCKYSENITIAQPQQFFANAGPDLVSVKEYPLEVTATASSPNGIWFYVWMPEQFLSCDTCNPVIASPDTTMQLVVMAVDSNGCAAYDTMLITVLYDFMTFFPTAFTPNGDGLNDFFAFDILGMKSAAVKIYNRWGELVYDNPNQPNGVDNINAWDGTQNGKPVSQDTYVYQIVVSFFNDEEKILNGTVTVVR